MPPTTTTGRTTTACLVHGKNDLRLEAVTTPERVPGTTAIDVAYGGICGSDLHYAYEGCVGDFSVREPLILGHEVVGRVAEADIDSGLHPGDPVAIHPATPCNQCSECTSGHRNRCADTRYLGSAACLPHVQGGFASRIVVPTEQAHTLPEGLRLDQAVLAEPLSVALHAVARAGDVTDKTVLVNGAGPIGLLVVAALRTTGVGSIVVSDLQARPLELAAGLGATVTERVDAPQDDDDSPEPEIVDVAIEASGTVAGLSAAVRRVRRGGTVVCLGLLPSGDIDFPANLVITRELHLVGTYRFDTEFTDALNFLAAGVDLTSITTHRFGLEHIAQAFTTATDRAKAAKVILDFGGVNPS